MIYLDCENINSTMDSLAQIYGVTCQDIESFFQSFDIERHYEINEPNDSGDRELRNVFEATIGCEPKKIERVHWFHLTRTLPETDFKEGILPLSRSLDNVWSTFFNVFCDTVHFKNLKELSEKGVSDFQFNLKSGNSEHSGPYAMLVKEVAYQPKDIGNHDYLWLPEIMEDICNGYKKDYGVSIHTYLNEHLKPKIVKFWSDSNTSMSCIESALYYAYLKSKSEKLSSNANAYYDGKNIEIFPDQIVQIAEIKG
ncbi:MAG: hypothetical protein KZQ83_10260 [gamma proteobacterium symbiont of Taylorina sp.]|nr:hypothetical protein [gamma proteobacterium symbiont of Taylorina sp.]